MKKQDQLHDELNEHAPFLNDIRKQEDGMRVPDDYFDQLEANVFRQLDALGARPQPITFGKKQVSRSWWQWAERLWRPRIGLALAGVFALALGAWWHFGPGVVTESDRVALAAAALSAEDVESYFLDNLQELEPEQIALVLPLEELPAISIEPTLETTPKTPAPHKPDFQISRDDLDDLLRDMSEEELEKIL